MSRRETILVLLDHWPEFFEPAASGKVATSSDGTGPALLSAMSRHPSVVELGRCLGSVRKVAPNHFRYVVGFYGAEWRTTDKPVARKTVGGRRVVELARVRERVLSPELRRLPTCSCGCGLPRPVCLAVDVVCDGWDVRVVCELPLPLRAKLTTAVHPETGEQVWTEKSVA